MKIKKLFRREKVIEGLKSFRALRFRVSHSSLVHASLLLLILFLAFIVRLLPLRWGFHLSEFDPHWQYRLTKHMVDNGFFAWTSWHDYMSWYPSGRDVAQTSFPGLAFTAAFFYLIARALGLPLAPITSLNPLSSDPIFNFCVIFPVIMGTLTCLVIYFLGKDIGGKEVGLFSAFFLALNSSYISRTSLGFFDDETVGIFGILLFIFFFLRSIEAERRLKDNLIYAVAAGLSLGYIFSSWGASRYPVGMTVLFVFVLLLLRRYSSRLLLSYSTTFGIALFIAINVPFLGFGFLTEITTLAVFGIFLLLCLCEITRYIRTIKMKTFFVFCFSTVCIISFFVLSWYGYVSPLSTKFWSVLDPFERIGEQPLQQLVQSVQEHRPAAWGSFYYDLGIGAFFVPVGLFFAAQTPTNRNLFLCIFGLTSIYFAGSMVRLTLLMGPAFCLLWALALVRLLRPFITIMKEAPVIPRRKMRLEAHVGKEFSGAFLIMMLLLLTFTFVLPSPVFPRVLDNAYVPTTIASASMPVKPAAPVSDWLDALIWIRNTLALWEQENHQTAVVASWWDYGYWITIIGNKTTLADNGTLDLGKIAKIGEMFMSNETEAIEILRKYHATHVVVFTTFDSSGRDMGWGDEGKWRWMARIAGLNDSSFGNYSLGEDQVRVEGQEEPEIHANPKGQNTTLYKLMTFGKHKRLEPTLGAPPTEVIPEHFELAYWSQGVPALGAYYALVCVYEIRYG